MVAPKNLVVDGALHALNFAVVPDHLLANQDIVGTNTSIMKFISITKPTIDAPVSIGNHAGVEVSKGIHVSQSLQSSERITFSFCVACNCVLVF